MDTSTTGSGGLAAKAGAELNKATEGGAAELARQEAEARAAFDTALKAAGLQDEAEEPEEDEGDEPKAKKNTPGAKPLQDAPGDVDEDDEEQDEDSDVAKSSDEDGEDEDDEDEEETDDDGGSSTEYERALRLLKLKHFTADDLKSLSRSRVIEIAASIRQDEAALTKKLEAKSKERKASEQAAERTDAGDQADKAKATPKGLRAHATRLAKVFDDEASNAIIETLEGAAGEFEGAFNERITELGSRVEELAKLNTELRLENFRVRIQRRHPEDADALDDDRTWRRMVKRMSALKDTGEYKSADQLADDVLGHVLKDRNDRKQSLRDREKGRQDAPKNRVDPPKAMTQDGAMRAAFDAALEGDKRRLQKLERVRIKP